MILHFKKDPHFDYSENEQTTENPNDITLSVLPLSTEKYLSFSAKIRFPTNDKCRVKKGKKKQTGEVIFEQDETGKPVKTNWYQTIELKFLDSRSFMSASLEKLTESFKMKSSSDYKDFADLKTTFSATFTELEKLGCSNVHILQLLSKGIYPYNFMKNSNTFFYGKLPPIEEFKSDLTCKDPTDNNFISEIKTFFKYNVFYVWKSCVFNPDEKNIAILLDTFFRYFISMFPFSNGDSEDGLISVMKQLLQEQFSNSNDVKFFVEDITILFEKFMVVLQKQISEFKDEAEYYKTMESLVQQVHYFKASKVWKEFGCNKFIDYHDLYLRMDVLLLSDIIANFRKFFWDQYNLDCFHYYGLPGLSWDCMLKNKMISDNQLRRDGNDINEVEILSDIDMIVMFMNAKRGGMCCAGVRYSEAGRITSPEGEEFIKENIYTDANNQYGWAMSQKLPHSKHKWLSDEELERWRVLCDRQSEYYMESFDPIASFDPEGDVCYFLEVDLSCPEELHDYFSDYPEFPEGKIVSHDMKSEWQKSFNKTNKVPKLLMTLQKKENYTVHILLLQLGLKHGYKLDKIHRIYSSYQERWINSYMKFNNDRRKIAKTPFEKDICKLSNNIIYGKCCETDANKFSFELVSTREEAMKLIHKDTYTGQYIIYDKHLVGVSIKPRSYKYRRNLPVACAILDLSKYLMFKFYYDHMKPKFDLTSTPLNQQRCRMLYTDTDSFIISIKTPIKDRNMYYNFILPNHKEFDLSCYYDEHEIWKHVIDYVVETFSTTYDKTKIPLESACFQLIGHKDALKEIIKMFKAENCGVLGKFKDENGEADEFSKFIALRAKCYALIVDNKYKSKCKGVIKSIYFESYHDALFNNETCSVNQTVIRSHHHKLGVQNIVKIAFSVYDDKRYIVNGDIENLIETLPYGHYRINA